VTHPLPWPFTGAEVRKLQVNRIWVSVVIWVRDRIASSKAIQYVAQLEYVRVGWRGKTPSDVEVHGEKDLLVRPRRIALTRRGCAARNIHTRDSLSTSRLSVSRGRAASVSQQVAILGSGPNSNRRTAPHLCQRETDGGGHPNPSTEARTLATRAAGLFPLRVVRESIEHGCPSQAVLIACNALPAVLPIALGAIRGVVLTRGRITRQTLAECTGSHFPTDLGIQQALI
jgi:hypothetical protein